MDPVSKRRLHPLVAVASVSVIVLSAVGVAAITGLLPVSRGSSGAPDRTETSAPRTERPSVPRNESARRGEPARLRTAPVARARPACLDCGVVESVRRVTVRGQGTGLGAVAGGVVGAVLGNQLGNGSGRTVMTLAGAAGGAFAGNQIEKNARTTRHWDVYVRLTGGHTRVIPYAAVPPWRAGDRVRIVNGAIEPLG